MSKASDENLRGVPMKPYDLIREGLIILAFIAVVVIVLGIFWPPPDYPTVRGEEVAKNRPVDYVKTAADILAGNSSLQDYGPPYNADPASSQKLLGISPITWFGVRQPLDPSKDFVLTPLERVAVFSSDIAAALKAWQAASDDARTAWTKAYIAALDKATVENGNVQVAKGDYGPVPVMMKGMLDLGKAGLLEGALESNDRQPYALDTSRALLFFQEDVDSSVANTLDMTGGQWGITHEVGNHPGPWWLWPYAIWYQIPGLNTNPNADLIAILIVLVLFLVLFFLPLIPGLNRIPLWLGFYKIVWRDWYARRGGSGRSKT
ncbi:MAG: hypothetical protein ABSG17_11125 [Spirochaetia bacterium]|jgi:hypothetical protein